MKTPSYLGVDTSNYTTSIALCNGEGEIVDNMKMPLCVKSGECGLRQSDAVFEHIKNIPYLTEKLKEMLIDCEIIAVGCSDKPRNIEGSYMPCFLTGLATASTAAAVSNSPLYRFSHQEGHVAAALYSAGITDLLDKKEFGVFHVSGGTSELLFVNFNKQRHENILKIELVGKTEDLNAGQAVDRIGVLMGFGFPCGSVMERCVEESNINFDIPKSNISVKGLNCNLSGLQNKAEKLYRDTDNKALVSAFTFNFIGRTILKMSENFRTQFGDLPILYAGGVMSNKYIKEILNKQKNTYFAQPQFSADNAAGIAYLAYLTGKYK